MVINDARMREINFEFRRKDKPTDVLSFPQYTPHEIRGVTTPRNSAGTYLGDLVISSETTIRQAKHFGVTVRAELTRLIIHGILHLIGYDHEGVLPREAQAMRRRERALREVVE
jgi:probable rRNA maturation factor